MYSNIKTYKKPDASIKDKTGERKTNGCVLKLWPIKQSLMWQNIWEALAVFAAEPCNMQSRRELGGNAGCRVPAPDNKSNLI